MHNCKSVAIAKDIQIFPHAFGSSSIDIEIAWWTDSTPVDLRRSRGEFIATDKGALDDAGIEIPFPYRTLTFKETRQTKVLSEAAFAFGLAVGFVRERSQSAIPAILFHIIAITILVCFEF